jgi:hypothetical protein
MRVIIGLFCGVLAIAPALPQSQIQQVLVAAQTTSAVTFTTVQFVTQAAGCSGTSSGGIVACAITVTSTTAGNFGLLCGFSTSGSNGITASNTPTNEGTWVHTPSMVQLNKLNNGASQYYSQDCWHVLSLTGGVASITWNWATPSTTSTNVIFIEVHKSSGSWSIDASTSTTDAACTACVGPSGVSLTGTDYVVQIGNSGVTNFSSLSGVTAENTKHGVHLTTYTVYLAADINPQSSYAQPTWNLAATEKPTVGVIAAQ